VRRSRLLLILALAAAPLAAGSVPAAAVETVAPVTAQDRSIGRADAPVTVIEYASFACPACAGWHEMVYPVFRQRFVDTGRVRFVFRSLPTPPEEMSLPAHALARCSAPDRFFDVASALMRGQAAVLRGGTVDAWYAPAIAASGRTRAQIDACVGAPATRAAINRDIAGANAAGVDHTPSFFVNGRPVADRSLGGLEVAIQAAEAR
jgi:protein-disulfide isomerase